MLRWLPLLGGLFALSAAWRWQSPLETPTALAPGRAVQIVAANNRVEFDLPLSADEQYVVIVGNPSRTAAAQTFRVEARSVAQLELTPWKRLPNLRDSLDGSSGPRPRACASPTVPRRAGPKSREFSVTITGAMSAAPASYRRVPAKLVASGPCIDVYADPQDDYLADTPLAIVAAYETIVRPALCRWLGEPPDVDGDGAITVLLTSWLDRLEGGAVSLGGMVRPADYNPRGALPQSNHADVIYLSSGLRPGRHLEALLAHEMAHAMVAAARREHCGWLGLVVEEAWLSEGLAHVSEHLATRGWSNLDDRVTAFLDQPAASPLVVPQDAAARLARDPGCRGATYLFTRWLVERFGVEVLPRLIASASAGQENVAVATGCDFNSLVDQFAIDLYRTATGEMTCLSEHAPPDEQGDLNSSRHRSPFLARLDLAERAQDGGGPVLGAKQIHLASVESGRRQFEIAGGAWQYLLLTSDGSGVWRLAISSQSDATPRVTLIRRGVFQQPLAKSPPRRRDLEKSES